MEGRLKPAPTIGLLKPAPTIGLLKTAATIGLYAVPDVPNGRRHHNPPAPRSAKHSRGTAPPRDARRGL